METQLKRKHVRTRVSEVGHLASGNEHRKLTPGIHRISVIDRSSGTDRQRYVGSFILNDDHTVSFYGADMLVERAVE